MKWNNNREMKKCENCSQMIAKLPKWKKLCYVCWLNAKSGQDEQDLAKAEAQWEESVRMMVASQNKREE